MKKTKILNSVLVLSMILGSTTLMNSVNAQVIKEGETITITTPVKKMEDIVKADLKQYYEMNSKMRITKVQENIFEIDEQTTSIKASPTNNCSSMYLLLTDNEAVLIDGGNGECNSQFSEEFMKAIIDNIVGDRDLKVILTHLHGDHIGLLTGNYMDIIPSSVPVYIHEADYNALDKRVKDYYHVSTFKHNDLLSLAGYSFKVIDIPGHSDGSNALIDYEREIIFTGDAIGSGTVWLFDENNLVEYNQGIDYLVEAIKNMDNPVFYCGHRWQQAFPDAHSANVAVGEIGKQYVYEMDQLLEDILTNQYAINKDYAAMPYPAYEAIYSNNSDLNEDGIIPGILSVATGVNKYKDTMLIGDYTLAINEIKYQRTEKDGSKVEIGVTDEIKEMIDERVSLGKKEKTPVHASLNKEKKQINVDIALVNVYLDNHEYKNCMTPPGESYFNLLEFYADILQIRDMTKEYQDYSIVDINGKKVDRDYIETFVDLLDRIWNFDPTTNLKYRQSSIQGEEGYNSQDLYGGVDVIATSDDEKVSFTFHMDHHGFWGYEFGGDTFVDKVNGIKTSDDLSITQINTLYANFMQIELPELANKKGDFKWYILNNTDLENPYMYVGTNSKGENEALMIDVDFYGENVINDVIKKTIEERYSLDELDTLYIYLTHLYLDHVNNLATINKDPILRDKIKIIWPEVEEHPTLDGRDLITLFDYEDVEGTIARESRVINLKDGEQIQILDHDFELLSIPDQHTNGGSGLVDTTMKVYYSGDTLGSQIHLGGTSIWSTTGKLTQGWLDSMNKTVDVFNKYDVRYILTGHSPYPINKDYASWMGEAIKYIDKQIQLNPQFSGLVVVENGKVINGTKRFEEIFKTGLTDKEVFDFASINFMNFSSPQEDIEETPKEDTVVKTGDQSQIMLWSGITLLACLGVIYIVKKSKKEKH